MNTEEFISAFGADMPESQITLLRAAEAFYTNFYASLSEDRKFDFQPETDFTISASSDSSKTSGGSGNINMELLSGSSGFSGVPVRGIGAWQKSTFFTYDTRTAVSHEGSHAMLIMLGMNSTGASELTLAALASIADEALAAAGEKGLTGEAYLLEVANYVRSYLELDKYDYGSTSYTQSTGLHSDLLSKARDGIGSFENRFNTDRDLYGLAGLASIPSKYRTGYIAPREYADVTGDGGEDVEWRTYGAGESSIDTPGRKDNLSKRGVGIAWLGNQYDNTMIVGANLSNPGAYLEANDGGGNDYLDGGDGDDTLNGGKGADHLIGGNGNDLLIGGKGADTLQGGEGSDTYRFETDNGDDTIIDSDGGGKIELDGAMLSGSNSRSFLLGGRRAWLADDQTVIYVLESGTLADGTLKVFRKDAENLGSINIEEFSNGELTIELKEEASITILPGQIENPYRDPSFNPSAQAVSLKEGLGKQLTVAFNRPASAGARVRLEVTTGDGGIWSLLSGSETIVLSAGAVELEIKEGATEVILALVNSAEISANQSLQLKATYLDDGGVALASSVVSVDIEANVEAINDVAPGSPISGDREPIEYTDHDGSPHWHYDSWGNVVVDPTKPDPGRADTLYDTTANDLIQSGGGDDTVYKVRGGDDVVELGDGDDEFYTVLGAEGRVIARGGSGRDYLGAGSGRDLVEGGDGADGIYGSGEDDQLYGDAQGQASDFIAQGETQAGSGLQGEWFDGAGGDDQIFGGTGNDFVAGGDGSDLIVTGGGSDWIWGDWDTRSSSEWRNWTVTETVETDADGGKTYHYQVDSITTESNAGVGDDTIYAGAGDDVVISERGNDVVYLGIGNDKAWGGEGDDIILGGADNDVLNGDNGQEFLDSSLHGNDFLDGGDGNDELYGAGGADTLYGGSGDDSLWGESSDILPEFQGNDYLDGEDGNDELGGGGGADILYGGSGNDTLFGDSSDTPEELHGDDYLDGEQGDDYLVGAGGADTLIGGTGNDELYGDSTETPDSKQLGDYLDGGDGDDILVGGGGADTLLGGADNDELYGDSDDNPAAIQGADYLDGQGGDDILVGAGGDDTLIGGEGNDSLYGESSGTPVEAYGDDYLEGGAGADILVGHGGSDALYGGADGDSLYGDASSISGEYHGADFLDGGDGDDSLVGEGGSDTLLGGAGNDRLYGDSGSVASEYKGNDYLAGGNGDDELVGDGGDDVLSGDAGNDRLFGDGGSASSDQGSDHMSGGAGDDVLIGGGGSDTLYGDAGNDQLFGDGAGSVSVAEQSDTLAGGAGNDLLVGEGGDDTLLGGADNDQLYGGAGNDTLNGGSGNDLLVAGSGNDTLTGGAGLDVYVYNLGDGVDVITDIGENTLRFGSGIRVGDISLALGSLMINIGDTGGAIHVEGFDPEYPDLGIGITRFEFADGTVLNYDELIARGFDLEGTSGDDIIEGTNAVDRLRGFEGNDTIIAKAGDDLLDGGSGADAMFGNAGDDVYLVDDQGDTVTEYDAEGTDRVDSLISYTLGANVEDLTLTGVGDLAGIGNELANTITGNDDANWITAKAGDDTVFGAAGSDTLLGEAGNDVLNGGVGNDSLEGGEGDDELWGDADNDILHGGSGDDLVVGGTGADMLYGGAGVDQLQGGDGEDVLDGGVGIDSMRGDAGDDVYYVDDSADTAVELSEAHGNDTVFSSVSYELSNYIEHLVLTGADSVDGSGNLLAQSIEGNSGDNNLYAYRLNGKVDNFPSAPTYLIATLRDGNDERLVDRAALAIYRGAYPLPRTLSLYADTGATLIGGAGNDALFGDLDNDTLDGGDGNDLLYGFGGADLMRGGAGDDTYIVDGEMSLNLYGSSVSIEYVDAGGDTIVEEAGGGNDTVLTTTTYTLGAYLENLVLLDDTSNYDQDMGIYGVPASQGRYARDGFGNELNNEIQGNRFSNQLFGLGGNDTLFGGGGADRLDGGVGADHMEGGDASDTYVIDDVGDTVVESNPSSWLGGVDTVESSIDYVLGDNVENLTLTGAADLAGSGNSLSNVVLGNTGNNVLNGFGGYDQISGNEGQDTIFAGSGDDLIDGGSGADYMAGGAGNDRFYVDNEADTVVEFIAEGVDTVVSTVSYTLANNIENLYLSGSNSIDGTGNALSNYIQGNDAVNVIEGAAGNDEIDANGGNDIIDAGEGHDVISAGSGNDQLLGGAGNDLLDGGTGADTMLGGAGNDEYRVDSYWDAITEYQNEGIDSVESSVSLTLSDNVENLTLLGQEDLYAYGNSESNRIFGNKYENYIRGREGHDHLDGAAGDDDLYGDSGDDYLYGGDDALGVANEDDGGGAAAAVASIAIIEEPNYDEITLLSNDDWLDGGAGNDHLDGGSGDDVLLGGDGDDYLYGGDDGEPLSVSPPPDDGGVIAAFVSESEVPPPPPEDGQVFVNEKNDDVLYGGAGADTLDGGSRNDALFGGADEDVLFGGTGNDLLDGGTEIDYMAGGRGDDVYYVDGYSMLVEVPDPGDGGDGDGGDDDGCDGDTGDDTGDETGKGNEGVGNGEDPPPPGHDYNMNDGEGTSPGQPGNKQAHAHHGNGADDHLTTDSNSYDSSSLDSDTYVDHADDGAESGLSTTASETSMTPGFHTEIVWFADEVVEEADGGYDKVYSSVTYALTDHVEELHLIGSQAIDGTGNNLNNVLAGNAADNILDGGAGADVISGGLGDDVYVIDNEDDVVYEAFGEGNDTIRTSVSYGLETNVENLELIGEENIDAVGDDNANTLIGNAGSNEIVGNAGNDILDGGAGNDVLRGGLGDDLYRLARGGGLDEIIDTEGWNTLEFGGEITFDQAIARIETRDGNEVVHVRLLDANGSELSGQGVDFAFNAGTDATIDEFVFSDGFSASLNDLLVQTVNLQGTDQGEYLIGGRHDDIAYGGKGNDTIWTGTANDVLHGDDGHDVLMGDAGQDQLFGGDGRDALYGSYDEDLLFGGADDDDLSGGAGNDLLAGEGGRDFLIGDGGNDVLAGGADDDRIELTCGNDVVLYNFGDGGDALAWGAHKDDYTVSLGGGAALQGLQLSRHQQNLVLSVGASEPSTGDGSVIFEDWFDLDEMPQVTLQLVSTEMVDGVEKPRFDRLDFNKIAETYDATAVSGKYPNNWSISQAALDAHLETSNLEALGGEIAYQYGLHGNLDAIGIVAVTSVLTDPKLGKSPQAVSLS